MMRKGETLSSTASFLPLQGSNHFGPIFFGLLRSLALVPPTMSYSEAASSNLPKIAEESAMPRFPHSFC